MNRISIKNIEHPNPKKVKDVWNAFMAEGAVFGDYDIPYCPTTTKTSPRRIITWDEAKAIFKKQIKIDNHFAIVIKCNTSVLNKVVVLHYVSFAMCTFKVWSF